MKIVKDLEFLSQMCQPVKDKQEGGRIARRLNTTFTQWNKRGRRKGVGKVAVGLAAPQIGVQKQVCILQTVNTGYKVLMNPKIVDCSEDKMPIDESCLSFPSQTVTVYRHLWIEVETLNTGRLIFGPKDINDNNPDCLFAAVVAQHEIAHVYGKTIFDFQQRDYPHPSEWGTWER